MQGKQAVRDEQGVLSCLKRALKIANAAQQQVCMPFENCILVPNAKACGPLFPQELPTLAHLQLAVAARPRPRSGMTGGDMPLGGVSSLVASPGALFVEILNHYLLFFDQGCQQITTALLQVRLKSTALAQPIVSSFCGCEGEHFVSITLTAVTQFCKLAWKLDGLSCATAHG